jgi:hypothetical protein
VKIRLLRKPAERLNGVDISSFKTGDILELSASDAAVLIEDGWAASVPSRKRPTSERQATAAQRRGEAAERGPSARSAGRLGDTPTREVWGYSGEQERRRAEDRFREELHDARATTVRKRR